MKEKSKIKERMMSAFEKDGEKNDDDDDFNEKK